MSSALPVPPHSTSFFLVVPIVFTLLFDPLRSDSSSIDLRGRDTYERRKEIKKERVRKKTKERKKKERKKERKKARKKEREREREKERRAKDGNKNGQLLIANATLGDARKPPGPT